MWWRLFIVLLLLLCAGILPANAQSSPTPTVYVFPLFADGGLGGSSYRSTLRITKTSVGNPLQCTLTQRNTAAPFTGVDGNFYSADVLDAGSSPPAVTQITLDQFLPWEILRTGEQSPLKTGYAKLSCPGSVDTQLQFSLTDSSGNKLGEAAIQPATPGKSFQFLIDRRDGTRLGFSLANDSAVEGQFTLIARDQFNYEVNRAYGTIEPWSQISRFADEMMALPSNFAGTLELVGVTGGQNYVVGLQFTGTVFTTIQPLVRDTPLPN
ncbi:MAG TPA: hypothetical protein VE422_14045 [Terriglobia bacterium]|nr:hypothetical protein [Terriglobia bacterium]